MVMVSGQVILGRKYGIFQADAHPFSSMCHASVQVDGKALVANSTNRVGA